MDFKRYANTFKVLSDQNRLRILSMVSKEKEICACKILEQLNITQPTLAYHMKMLIDAGLVSCYKKGTWCIYKLERNQFNKIKDFLSDFNFEEEVK